MKFVWIFCNESISLEVMDLLETLDVEGYTVWRHVLGSHRGCRTHWGDEVWPGTKQDRPIPILQVAFKRE